MTKCRSCGAEIVWVRTAAGKAMPCDAALKPYIRSTMGGDRIVLKSGEVLEGMWAYAVEPDGYGYAPHWASCPGADGHRGKHK